MNDHSSLICHVNLANGFRGGERQTLLLIKALSERGFKQKLMVRKDSELSARSQSISGIDVLETNMLAFNAFSQFTDKTLFHFHDSRSFPMFYLSGLSRVRNYVFTRRVQRAPKMSLISKNIYSNAKNIICLSCSIEDTLKNLFGNDINTKIIPSCSANFNHSIEASLSIRKNIKQSFIAGHIGALDDSHKGQFNIVDLARKVKEERIDIGFLLIGTGRDEIALKEKSKDLDNIYFTGQVENIGDYLNAFDIFIFPSRHEGLGSTLLDALDYGLPVIASSVGGIPDIIENNKNGYLIDPDDSRGFFISLQKLFESEELRKKISENNLSKSLKFTKEEMADKYIKIYRELQPLSDYVK